MTQPVPSLPVLRLAGLHLDTLGNYFAALGLLRLAAHRWPAVKGCWRDGVFCLIGGPDNISELEAFVLSVGEKGEWTPYAVNLPKSTTSSTPEQKVRDLALWLAMETKEAEAVLALSHVATGTHRAFNPVFGNGGKTGNRLFAAGWKKAKDAILNEPKPSAKRKQIIATARQDLSAFLKGEACSLLSDYGAACWFSEANKKYNFSPDKPYCKGQITPWAMLLACEAFPLLVGATSRQLGSARKGTGAFPFVTQGTAPENEKEVETLTGEFWAPVWSKPLCVAEVSALYKRGRAEVNGRGAITSAAFAGAIIQRGTDAGLAEFRRFTLLRTTSAKTFESRLASVHPLEGRSVCSASEACQADAVSNILRFRDALPREFKKGKRWEFRGLQGPIDKALVRLASSNGNENAWALLDAVFASLERTANNKTYRKHEPALALLPVSWAVSLLQKEAAITPEIRIALALTTLRADAKEDTLFDKTIAPLLAYRVGVVPSLKNTWHKLKIAKNTPLRVEWSNRPLADNLAAVIRRRVAVEAESHNPPPFNTRLALPLADADVFLHGETDDSLISIWLDRFLLFDWSFLSSETHEALCKVVTRRFDDFHTDSASMLYAFFRPLFHAGTFSKLSDTAQPTSGMLRSIMAHLERGDTAAAFSAAQNRYKALLVELADFGENTLASADPRRLLAALLLPASPSGIAWRFTRFQHPQLTKKEQTK